MTSPTNALRTVNFGSTRYISAALQTYHHSQLSVIYISPCRRYINGFLRKLTTMFIKLKWNMFFLAKYLMLIKSV